MKCPHCDQEHSDDTLVCPMTGKPIVPEGRCPNCGRKVEAQWEVCLNCGALLDRTIPAETSRPLVQAIPTPPPAGEIPPQEAQSTRSETQPIKLVPSTSEQVHVFEDSATHAGVPQKTPRNHPFRWVTCGCLGLPLLLLLLVTVFFLADPLQLNLWGRINGKYDAAAGVMPDDAGVYLGVNIGNILRTRVDRVVTPFTVTQEANPAPSGFNYRPAKINLSSIQQANIIDDLLQNIETDTGIKIPNDLTPWIGQYAGIGIVGFQDSGDGTKMPEGWIIAVETRNNVRADAFLVTLQNNLMERQGMTFTSETYNGARLIVQNTDVVENSLSFGRSGRMLMVASDLGILKDAIDTQGKRSLDRQADYSKLINARPRNWSASVYINREMVGNAANDMWRGTPVYSAMPLISPLPSTSWTGMLVSATAIQNGFRVDSFTTLEPSAQSAEDTEFFQSLASPHGEVLKNLPQNTLLYFAGSRFDLAWQNVLGPFIYGGSDQSFFLNMFEQTFGFSLQKELLNYLKGQWALYAIPSMQGIPPDQLNANVALGLLAQAEAGISLPSLADKLNSSGTPGGFEVKSHEQDGNTYYEMAGLGTGNPILAFGISNGYAIITTDTQAFQSSLTDVTSLVSSATYQAAESALPGGIQPVIYVDTEQLFANIREGMQPGERENFNSQVAIFDPIKVIASGNSMTQPGIIHNSIVVLLKNK